MLIVGGGIAGVALADQLARAGVEVVLVERGELNREASGTNAGSMHLQIAIHQLIGGLDAPGEAERLHEETRLAVEAAGLWKELDAELEAGPARDRRADGRRDGGAAAAPARQAAARSRGGLETHVLEGAELRAFAPYLVRARDRRGVLPRRGPREPADRRARGSRGGRSGRARRSARTPR